MKTERARVNALTPAHAEHLARFRIPPDLLDAAGVRSGDDLAVREFLGIGGLYRGEDLAGIIFPYHDPVTGNRSGARARIDNPRVPKYLMEPGCRHLFFPPGSAEFLSDLIVTVVIVEAEKSALALRALCDRTGVKLLPIAVGGCWGFKRKTGKKLLPDGGTEPETGPSPDLDRAAWTGRKVIIAYDSNVATNDDVKRAPRALEKDLARRGATVLYAEIPSTENINGPDDVIAERGDEAMLSALDSAAPVGQPLRTDGGNADRFAQEHADSVRWCADQRIWYAWDGKRWQRDAVGEVMRRARLTASRMWDDVRAAPEEQRKVMAKWALHADSRAGLEAMVSLARFNVALEVRRFDEAFDRDPLLLNVANGIVDLRTGLLGPHRREAMITRITPTTFDARAERPRFAKFLLSTFDGELFWYVQRLAGYVLTGLTNEQAIWIFYGPTGTGKSTFVKILRGLLGEYATSLPDGALLSHKFQDEDDHAGADLPGVRLATAIETAIGRRLNEAKVKQLTGQDFVRARHLYENSFEFQPQAKLIIATNHRPVIKDTDDAIWRRIKPVEFCRQVPPEQIIRDLDKKLIEEEGSGILNWAIEGCKEWLAKGLQEPERVTEAARTYRNEQDEVAEWDLECCLRCKEGHEHTFDLVKDGKCFGTAASELYGNYVEWAKKSGVKYPINKTRFGKELGRLGLKGDQTGGTNRWLGIRLKLLGD